MSVLRGVYTKVPPKQTLRPGSIISTILAFALFVPYLAFVVFSVISGVFNGRQDIYNFIIANTYVLLGIAFSIVVVIFFAGLLFDFQVIRKYDRRLTEFKRWADSRGLKIKDEGDLRVLAGSVLVRINLKNLNVGSVAFSKDVIVADVSFDKTKQLKNREVTTGYIYQNVIIVPLGRQVPNIFFDSKRYKARALRYVFKRNQTEQLEGLFYKYFDIHSPIGYQLDFRSIVTPDTMEALIHLHECDIELGGDKLFVYSPLSSNTYDALEELIGRSLELKKQIQDNTATYIDERLPRTAGKYYVHPAGYKLRVRNLPLTKIIVGAIIYALVFVFLFITRDS